ncbi:LysR family transcriptional regulator [Ferrimonas pelagia]|uniref:HTH-type transcriptional regulator HdfR n=1 Tax=Ferrimonas pelagia TaxID=1177826 RepID=A0ABP9F5L7_9GAMM
MDTELLKTFLEVHRCGRFSRAAERLYLTQSAVSFRIRQLEQGMGHPLFVRQRSQLSLTPAGERLVPHAEAILAALARARQELGAHSLSDRHASLGASGDLWDAVLGDVVPRLCAALPELTLRAEVASEREMRRYLLEQRLDLGVMLEPPKTEGLNSEAMACLDLWPVSVDGTQTRYAHIGWPALETHFSGVEVERPIPALMAGSFRIALNYVLHAGGWAYLPYSYISRILQQQRLQRITSAPPLSQPVYLVWAKQNDNVRVRQWLQSTLSAQ